MKREILLSILLIAIVTVSPALLAQDANYDESKVPDYTLPALLTTQSGKPVESVRDWERVRRPEILRLFSEQVYGKTPTQKLPVRFEVTSVDKSALGGRATRKLVTAYFSADGKQKMEILIYLPNDANKPRAARPSAARPVPVFLGLNFAGNQTTSDDPAIPITQNWVRNRADASITDNQAGEASRGKLAKRWPVEQILARGYGVATVFAGDLMPDYPDNYDQGILPLFYKNGQTRPAPDEWGTVGAWAWGLSRALDYLETDEAVDGKRVAVVGHSRLGKASLWAGAQDERFAMVISNDSGEGGAAIARREYGERAKVMNAAFPHWFSDNYKQVRQS